MSGTTGTPAGPAAPAPEELPPLSDIAKIFAEDSGCVEKKAQLCGVLGIPTTTYNQWKTGIFMTAVTVYEFFMNMLEAWSGKNPGKATSKALLEALGSLDLNAAKEKVRDRVKAIKAEKDAERVPPSNPVAQACSIDCGSDSNDLFALSCGHPVCGSCVPQIEWCPLCRGNIEPMIQLYLR